MASDGEISCANDPNFAVIYSFLKVFSKLYGLEVPSLAKLQEYIENTQEVSESLKELHLRLLRRALKSVLSSRWEKGLIKFCHQQGHHQEAWEIERFSYKKASTQVKLEVLKLLLEYQFTCHPKFKTAVNALSCKELRLNPIGRDKSGCVYWLEVDDDANLCLFKEDQDEETWQLVARNRDELVKVITQLKTGEEVCPLNTCNVNEDSSSAEITPKESGKSEVEEDNEEEFLSPESESEHESECKKVEVPSQEEIKEENSPNHTKEREDVEYSSDLGESNTNDLDNKLDNSIQDDATEPPEESKVINEEVGEAIEEPVMMVTGEGNGVDCDSTYIGEEIVEEVIYFYGEGYGYENDTGNPDVIEQRDSPERNSDNENANEEFVNGECELDSSNKSKLGKGLKLKSSLSSVNKRSLKKQCNDTAEVLKPESKKHCIRDIDKSDSSLTKHSGSELKCEASVNDKTTTDSESTGKNYVRKGRRSRVKKKIVASKQFKMKERKEIITSILETDNGHDSKTNIIEKRKSSVSSEDHDETSRSDNDKDKKSPEKELKVEDPLPPKKLRLETMPESDVNLTHSEAIENDKEEDILNYPISQRKRIKASKGKFKRKNIADGGSVNKSNSDNIKGSDKKVCKSLKRSLLDATVSDKNKSESHSDSEEDEPVTSGKRLKIKPKKIIKSSRKNVEAKKLSQTHSSDESDDETLYSLAGKKTFKKLMRKKPKDKEKHRTVVKEEKCNSIPADDNSTPVRTSRRIALMKIKEQSQGKHVDENITPDDANKKQMKEEEEWRESGASSSDGERGTTGVAGRRRAWRGSASSGPEPDSESDEPLFELAHEEPELNFDKSDHEFSPESDLECGEPVEPLKRARTLQEEQDEGFCKRCGSGEQPEWILLCDQCDAGYHASCLKPMLFLVPEGDWFCPQCNHDRLIKSLESELAKYDQLLAIVEAERARREEENPLPENEEEKDHNSEKEKEKSESGDDSGSSGWSSSSSSSEGAVYRLRTRKQLPVSYRAREYDRLISTAIKEEFVEATTSAGNQGRGKDISTIIEAAEEEKLKREAIEQGKPVEAKKMKRKQRRKPRKLNSLDVPSEDDDETDEDFKDTGMESSSEDISSSAERESTNDSRSSDSLPIRRMCRTDKKERPKLAESSPDVKKKKKKGVFDDSSSDSIGGMEWSHEKKSKKSKWSQKKRDRRERRDNRERRDKRMKSKRRRRGGGLTQYDAEGNVVRARVTYGGLSDEGANDWSPKHRTRQKKINYTEMPNTESEDEMHKSSGKHMPDSSDEFKVSDSELSSGSDGGGHRDPDGDRDEGAERRKALRDLIKTAVVPLEKLPDDVARAKTEELHAHLNAQAALNARPGRGRGSRGGRGTRGGRGRRGRGVSTCVAAPPADGDVAGGGEAGEDDPTEDAFAKLVGVKIKDLSQDTVPLKHNQAEREKKRLEREAKQAEKEARRIERLQKKEEKEKLKEQRAKEREEKRLAKLALQESKRIKKEKSELQMGIGFGAQVRPERPLPPVMQRVNMYGNAPLPIRHPTDYQEQRFPATPRLQVRAELRRADAPPDTLRDGTLSVAGSPQPFKPVSEEPSIITRMPHMINHQYRGPVMYGGNNPPFGPPRPPQNVMYPHHFSARGQYPPRGYGPPPPPYPPRPPSSSPGPAPRAPSASSLAPYRAQPPPGPPRPHMGQFGPHGPGPISGAPARPPPGPPPGPVTSPATLPPRSTPPAVPAAPLLDLPMRIKAEVKTEPEYRSPVSSPAPPSPGPAPLDPPRHPKIKHTENKDRRPRHPLGPYAPHYGPYGPYAPGPGPPPPEHQRPPFGPPPYHLQRPPYPQFPPPVRPVERPRSPEPRPAGPVPELVPGPRMHPPESYMPVHLRAPGPGPERLAEPRAPPPESYIPPGPPAERVPAPEVRQPAAEPYLPVQVRAPARQPSPYNAGGFTSHAVQRLLPEPEGEGAGVGTRDDGGVFGGLVSYFSSQHEADMDA